MKRSKYDFNDFIDRNFYAIASIYVEQDNIDTDTLIEENSNYLDESDKDRLPEDILEDNAMSDIVFCWAENNEMEVKRLWLIDELHFKENIAMSEKQLRYLNDLEFFFEEECYLDFEEDEAKTENIWRKLIDDELSETETFLN